MYDRCPIHCADGVAQRGDRPDGERAGTSGDQHEHRPEHRQQHRRAGERRRRVVAENRHGDREQPEPSEPGAETGIDGAEGRTRRGERRAGQQLAHRAPARGRTPTSGARR